MYYFEITEKQTDQNIVIGTERQGILEQGKLLWPRQKYVWR